MKSLLFKSLLVLIYFANLNTITAQKFTGETYKFQDSPAGQLNIISMGYGTKKTESIQNAVENGIKNILLHGIPESNQSTPLLGLDAIKSYESNIKYFESFFKSEIDKYIIQKNLLEFKYFKKKSPSSKVNLIINLTSLKEKLISDKIIRSFGI